MVIHSLADVKKEDVQGEGGIPAGAMAGPVDGEKLSKSFMGIHHEKQIGSLCAVHCINNLIQAPEFDEIQLAEIAGDMDRRERAALAGSGLEHESGNVRADGFFSVQVIQAALQLRGLTCIPIGSSEAAGVLQNPQKETGFILNRSEHWFSLRRLGQYWFDLNSTQEKPKYVSDAYLGMLLSQMKQDGYSVFVVRGRWNPARIESDRKALDALVAACKDGGISGAVGGGAAAKPSAAATAFQGAGYSLKGPSQEDKVAADAALAAALAASGVDASADPELAAAIAESLRMEVGGGGGGAAASAPPAVALDPAEEMRRKRLARFG